MPVRDTAAPTLVRPGLWALTLPLPGPPDLVTVYVLETDAGPYLVDAGWDTEDGWRALSRGLAAIGTRVEEVRGVLVSHSHMDHYGLAPRIRASSGAWIALHPLDAAQLSHYRIDPAERLADVLRRAGAPDTAVDRALAGLGKGRGHDAAAPDVLLEDGQRPEVPGWDLTALWTPGHSPGHLCFWEGRQRLLLAGDQVLPHTVVAVHEPEGPQDDPLGGYLESLDRLERLRPTEVLPAHEHRFTDLSGRVGELRAHHSGRVARVAEVLDAGPATAWELAGRVRSRGTLDDLHGFPLHVVVTRTLAQLSHLRRQGLAEEVPGPPPYWAPTGRGVPRSSPDVVGHRPVR
ncbi:MBL fold metallo-hydrolase [Streptomyces sp. SID4956]|uniref:MBL fold metallo-hydrolase n=1 Tax=Streptomyces sp. SID4956 TaxID=2690290 RepID=UPI00136F4A32|nr:MBL fold metallo-hydrolase [Streptomyces sp. SID4956]